MSDYVQSNRLRVVSVTKPHAFVIRAISGWSHDVADMVRTLTWHVGRTDPELTWLGYTYEYPWYLREISGAIPPSGVWRWEVVETYDQPKNEWMKTSVYRGGRAFGDSVLRRGPTRLGDIGGERRFE